jgi:NDP-sugar pyrophosphorylase family protein
MLERDPSLVAIDSTATVAATAGVTQTVVGPGANIGDRADVVESVVMRGAAIGAGARIRRSIIGPDAVVGENVCIDELTVVGGGVHVASGEHLAGARVPDDQS